MIIAVVIIMIACKALSPIASISISVQNQSSISTRISS